MAILFLRFLDAPQREHSIEILGLLVICSADNLA